MSEVNTARGQADPDLSPELPEGITRILMAWGDGDPEALHELMPLVCNDLRTMARRYLSKETAGNVLQPTPLVNELFLRLHGRRKVDWKNRAQFFGFAAQTMRIILGSCAPPGSEEAQIRCLTPIYHPNINSQGTHVCIDLWYPGKFLDELCILLGRVIQFRNFNPNNPLRLDAALWAKAHSHLVPVDTRSFRSSGLAPDAYVRPFEIVIR